LATTISRMVALSGAYETNIKTQVRLCDAAYLL